MKCAPSEPPDELDQKRVMDLVGEPIVEAPSEPPNELDLKRTMDLVGDQIVEEQSAMSRAH